MSGKRLIYAEDLKQLREDFIAGKIELDSEMDMIDACPTVDTEDITPKWISVEERLPETIQCVEGIAYSEAVIVWTNGRKAMAAVWDGEHFLCAAEYWEAWDEHVTHWMPLPKPPIEARTEG